jgi:hypothetical protein
MTWSGSDNAAKSQNYPSLIQLPFSPFPEMVFKSHFKIRKCRRKGLINEKSLPDLSVKQGQIGDGSSPHSLSRIDIWRTRLDGAVDFPTLFSTASGVCGLVAGPSNILRY